MKTGFYVLTNGSRKFILNKEKIGEHVFYSMVPVEKHIAEKEMLLFSQEEVEKIITDFSIDLRGYYFKSCFFNVNNTLIITS